MPPLRGSRDPSNCHQDLPVWAIAFRRSAPFDSSQRQAIACAAYHRVTRSKLRRTESGELRSSRPEGPKCNSLGRQAWVGSRKMNQPRRGDTRDRRRERSFPQQESSHSEHRDLRCGSHSLPRRARHSDIMAGLHSGGPCRAVGHWRSDIQLASNSSRVHRFGQPRLKLIRLVSLTCPSRHIAVPGVA